MSKLRKFGLAMAVMAVGVLVFSANAFATAAYPLSGVSTGFTDQITNAVDTALPIAGPIVALFVGWRVFKRLARG